MSYVELDLAKAHLAVFHNADDALIQQCIDAAEQYAADFMNRPAIRDDQPSPWNISNIDVEEGSSEVIAAVPASVVQAILMMTANNYNNRESIVTGTIVAKNPMADAMLHMHRVGLGV